MNIENKIYAFKQLCVELKVKKVVFEQDAVPAHWIVFIGAGTHIDAATEVNP